MNVLELFAGAGGGILGGLLLGHRCVCAVEIDGYAADRLIDRQDDGILPPFPVWRGDVRGFDGRPWLGRVDLVAGGFPCQDISSAGRGAGIGGKRSGLWSEFVRVVREARPRLWFVENSPMLTSRGLGRVLGDMAALGYDAEWCVLGAKDVGAPHKRDRIWILAHTDRDREHVLPIDEKMAESCSPVANAHGQRGGAGQGGAREERAGRAEPRGSSRPLPDATGTGPQRVALGSVLRGIPPAAGWWQPEPSLDRVAHGVANRVGQLRALGNGQVPAVHALAFRVLLDRLQSA